MYTSKRKPRKCPGCGSRRVANVLYGMPAFSEELERDLAAGKVTIGGCDPDGPRWQCADCGVEIQREGDPIRHDPFQDFDIKM